MKWPAGGGDGYSSAAAGCNVSRSADTGNAAVRGCPLDLLGHIFSTRFVPNECKPRRHLLRSSNCGGRVTRTDREKNRANLGQSTRCDYTCEEPSQEQPRK